MHNIWAVQIINFPKYIQFIVYHNCPFRKTYDLRGLVISKGIQPFTESHGKRTFIWKPDETIRSGVYIVGATMENGRRKVKRVILIK